MYVFNQRILVAGVFTLLGITGLLTNARQAVAQNPNPGSAPVNIVASVPLSVTGNLGVAGTVNVRNVDNAVRMPFQASLRNDIISLSSLTVDSDKNLTIEFIAAECEIQLPVAQTNSGTGFTLRTTAAANAVSHRFHPRYIRIFQSTGYVNSYYGSADMTRIYADAGTNVSFGGVQQGFFCVATLSGYTVPK